MGGAATKNGLESSLGKGAHGASLIVHEPFHLSSQTGGESVAVEGGTSSQNAIRPAQLGVPLLVRYPYLDFRLQEVIGRGRFSTVYKASSLKDVSLKVAIKEVKLADMNRQQLADFRYELNLLSNLRHPNLARIASVFDPNTNKSVLYVVTEYLCGGELIPAICRQRHYMETDCMRFIQQLTSAVNYLHTHAVVHGRIIPENIILTHTSFESPVRLVDFGLAQAETSHHHYFHPSYLHLQEFHVPEAAVERRVTPKMDIWCIGVVAYIILSGQIPFEGLLAGKPLTKDNSFEDPRWTYVSPDAIDFLCKVLVFDEKERPTAEEMLKHPWLSSLHQSLLEQQRKAANARRARTFSNSSTDSVSERSSRRKGGQFKTHRDTFQLERLKERANEGGGGDDSSSKAESSSRRRVIPRAKSSDKLIKVVNRDPLPPSLMSPDVCNRSKSSASEESILYENSERKSYASELYEDDEDDEILQHYDLSAILPHIRAFHESRQLLQPVMIFSATINFTKAGRYMHEKNFAILGSREKNASN